MTAEEFKEVAKKGQNIQREKLSPDVYAGKKLSDEFTLIAEVDEKLKKWSPIEASELKKGQRFISLANVEVLQTGRTVSIAVPSGFEDLTNGSYFVFKIDAKGYSDVKVEKLSKAQAEKLISADEIA